MGLNGSQEDIALYRHGRPHAEIWRRYSLYGVQRGYWLSVLSSTLVFVVGLAANAYSITFASERASNPVTDIILSNTPALEVDGLFVYGTLILSVITILLCAAHPKRVPFSLYSVGLFFIIRSIFVSLTHLAPFEPHTTIEFGARITKMFFGGDLFFSGHTGLPFLAALAFWHRPKIRYFYIGGSLFFATIVLLGHLHYTIDVASAFFITYGIFHISEWLFPKSRALFYSDKT